MSPITDPFAARERREALDREAARTARLDVVRPSVLLAVGFVGTMIWIAVRAAGDPEGPNPLLVLLGYPLGLAIEVAAGLLGLYVAARLWLGGAGPLVLGALRLAGIYAFVDLLQLASALLPVPLIGLAVCIIVYVWLLKWLFDVEWSEAIMIALITGLIKALVGFTLMTLIY